MLVNTLARWNIKLDRKKNNRFSKTSSVLFQPGNFCTFYQYLNMFTKLKRIYIPSPVRTCRQKDDQILVTFSFHGLVVF